jgi:hypothetical protein
MEQKETTMTKSDRASGANEAFYDSVIAPELLKLAKLCKARDMAFVACVEYDPANSGIGRTEFCPEDSRSSLSAAQRTTHWAARCRGNVDVLISWFKDHGMKHGHNSIYLARLISDDRNFERLNT